jgi:hypothetical protein
LDKGICAIHFEAIYIQDLIFTQVFYKAHGAAASVEWAAMISPCVHILRQITTTINSMLGSYQGSKHKSPKLHADLRVLMESLRDHCVYEYKEGRTLDDDDTPTPNTISLGLEKLKPAIEEYNNAFLARQLRYSQTPVIDRPSEDTCSSSMDGTPNTDPAIVSESRDNATIVHEETEGTATTAGTLGTVTTEDPMQTDSSNGENEDDNEEVLGGGGQVGMEDEGADEEAFKCAVRGDVALDSDVESESEEDEACDSGGDDDDDDIN